MKKLLIVAMIMFATACNVTPQPAPLNDQCADTIARAAISAIPIAGAYNCFDAASQKELKNFNPPALTDADIATGRLMLRDGLTGAIVPISIAPCGGLVKVDANTSKKSYELYATDSGQLKKYDHAVLTLKVSKPDSKVGVISFETPATCLVPGAEATPLP